MDFRVKALRVSGQKDFVDSLHRLFTDKKELLKEKDFDIIAPIDVEVDGSLSFVNDPALKYRACNSKRNSPNA